MRKKNVFAKSVQGSWLNAPEKMSKGRLINGWRGYKQNAVAGSGRREVLGGKHWEGLLANSGTLNHPGSGDATRAPRSGPALGPCERPKDGFLFLPTACTLSSLPFFCEDFFRPSWSSPASRIICSRQNLQNLPPQSMESLMKLFLPRGQEGKQQSWMRRRRI